MFFPLNKCIFYAAKPFAGLLRRALTNSSGSTTVEFAFIVLPFLAVTFAILEASLVFFGGHALEHAVNETGRLVRTGQAQAASMSKAEFKEQICSQVTSVFNCNEELQIELVTFSTFQAASDYAESSDNSALDPSGDLRDDFSFEINSDPEQIVLLRAFYEWDLTLAFPGIGLDNMDNGKRLLTAVTIFKNEPFD